MNLVFLCSPYAGDIERNTRYVRAALADSLLRGEAPFAPHALYTLPGVLKDSDPKERALGIEAGSWYMMVADRVAIYVDLGISAGMQAEIKEAQQLDIPIEERRLEGWT